MNEFEGAEKVLKTMLSTLGFEVDIETKQEKDGPCMHLTSANSEHIIGKNGDRLEDLQYLLNRITAKRSPSLPRIKVDCENFRHNLEGVLLDKVKHLAEKVKEDGKPARTRPLNAYYRRMVHNVFADDEEITTSSGDGDSRFKRVVLSKKES